MRVGRRSFLLSWGLVVLATLSYALSREPGPTAALVSGAALIFLSGAFLPTISPRIGEIRLTLPEQAFVVCGLGLVGGPEALIFATLLCILSPVFFIVPLVRRWAKVKEPASSIDFVLGLSTYVVFVTILTILQQRAWLN